MARKTRLTRRAFLYGGSAAVVAGVATWQFWPEREAGAGPVTTDSIGDQVQRLPRGQLPVFTGSGDTQRLYRYAVEHGDELAYVPCFCGCYRFGHTSNQDCYIKGRHADGTITFTGHAAT